MKPKTRAAYCLLDADKEVIERLCTSCKHVKPGADFYKLEHGPGGKHTICKPCLSKRVIKSTRKRHARNKLNPEQSLREHNVKMLSKSSSGEFRLMDVRTRSVSPELIIREAHPGTHIVCLRKRIQGESQLLLLEMSMDGDTLHEMLLHNHWKIGARVGDIEADLGQKITHIENIRRLPFSSESLIAMLSSPTYYLWMTNPRPLTPVEISDVYDIPKSSLEFILPPGFLAHPPGGDMGENISDTSIHKEI